MAEYGRHLTAGNTILKYILQKEDANMKKELPKSLQKLIDIVQEKFTAFGATAEKIVLARAVPYEELRSWNLK